MSVIRVQAKTGEKPGGQLTVSHISPFLKMILLIQLLLIYEDGAKPFYLLFNNTS